MLLGLDHHGAAEQGDALPWPGEAVRHRDAALEAAVTVAIMAQTADRIEHEHRGPIGAGQLPAEEVAAVWTRLVQVSPTLSGSWGRCALPG